MASDLLCETPFFSSAAQSKAQFILIFEEKHFLYSLVVDTEKRNLT
jgi:hypothetical protein